MTTAVLTSSFTSMNFNIGLLPFCSLCVIALHIMHIYYRLCADKKTLITFNNVTIQDMCVELLGLSETQRFQSVYGGHSFVFSAYLDDLYPDGYREVKITGLTLQDNRTVPRLFCFLRFAQSTSCELIPAVVEKRKNAFGQRFNSAVFSCAVTHPGVPIGVSLVSTDEVFLSNKMAVIHDVTAGRKSLSPMLNFTVCIAPLHNVYNDTNQLLVAVEFNRLLGAERFVFYNHSVSPALDVLLRSLTAEGVAEVIQWPLPTPHIHYYGQFVAVNDCVFRNARRAKFVINTDLDEFIVPQKMASWEKLSSQVLERYPDVGGFIVKVTHFYTSVANHSNDVSRSEFVREHNILPLLNTNRTLQIFPKGKRAKYIVRPCGVSDTGVHGVRTLKQGFTKMFLPSDQAMVYHYRNELKGGHRYQPTSYITDLSAYKYKHALLAAIANRVENARNFVKNDLK